MQESLIVAIHIHPTVNIQQSQGNQPEQLQSLDLQIMLYTAGQGKSKGRRGEVLQAHI